VRKLDENDHRVCTGGGVAAKIVDQTRTNAA
jgi:hypothetical protein